MALLHKGMPGLSNGDHHQPIGDAFAELLRASLGLLLVHGEALELVALAAAGRGHRRELSAEKHGLLDGGCAVFVDDDGGFDFKAGGQDE